MQDFATGRNRAQQELVAFRVMDQDFCIDIMAVREIRGWSPTTLLPHAQDYVTGVINLRGAVVPVVDLSARLGLGAIDPGPRHVVIIVLIGRQLVGLLADVVSDILSVPLDALEPVPDMLSEVARAQITGVLMHDDRMIRKIDLHRLLPEAALEVA